MHPKHFLMKTPFAIGLILLAIASLGAVIGLFVKANEHSKDLTLEKYYEFTHYAILSLTVFIGLIVWYFTYCSGQLYNRWNGFQNDNRYTQNQPYSCDRESYKPSANVKRVTLIGAIVFLLGSIIAYVTTVEIKSNKEEYHKRCTVGSVLLLLSVCTFLFDTVYIWYKKLSGCHVKGTVGVVSDESQPTELTDEQRRIQAFTILEDQKRQEEQYHAKVRAEHQRFSDQQPIDGHNPEGDRRIVANLPRREHDGRLLIPLDHRKLTHREMVALRRHGYGSMYPFIDKRKNTRYQGE
jgi:hypothetical protein